MIKACLLTALVMAATASFAQVTNPTLDEFMAYDDTLIYSNLYHAVNERCHALMLSRDPSAGESYQIEPIPELYEVAYKGTLRSAVTNMVIGTNTYTVTNNYLGYEVAYPAAPPTGHVWALISSAQYPPDEPVLMRRAESYGRWRFTVSAPTGLTTAAHYDLGMAIHQKTALLIGSEQFGLSFASPAEVMNTSTGLVWEWNDSRVEWLYDWNYTNWHDVPGYVPIWSNIPPPNFEWPCGLSEEFPNSIGLGPVDPMWMVKGSNYPSIYPPLTHAWLTLSNGIGISATNYFSYTNAPSAVTNVIPGWMGGCLSCYYVTSIVTAVTQTNVTLSMTNFSYHFPYPFAWTNGGYEYLENRAPVASIKFKFDNYTQTIETNLLVQGGVTNVETITTKERDIVLDLVNYEGINDLPADGWRAYIFDEINADIELQDPKIDEGANVHVYYRKATNDYYDTLFDYDLPDFYHVSRSVTNRLTPGHAIKTNHFGQENVDITPNAYNEPFDSGYHFTLYPGTNSTADFVLSNGVHSFRTTEVIYSIRTNLNAYFPPFPINDEIIFLGRPLEYRLIPHYDGPKARISKQWMWQRWLQLSQMRVTRARITEYSSTWTNHHTKMITEQWYAWGPGSTTNIISTNQFSGQSPFEYGPLLYNNSSEIETYTNHDDQKLGHEETMTFSGQLKFLKTTNVAATLVVLTGNRYAGNRWVNQGMGIYQGLHFSAAFVLTDDGGYCYSNRSSAYRLTTCSWDLLYPDGSDLFVDEMMTAQRAYNVGIGVGEIDASWDFPENDAMTGATVDDRQVLPEIEVLCEYGGNTYTNVLPEIKSGSKRVGYYGEILNMVEPIWEWAFQWPAVPD